MTVTLEAFKIMFFTFLLSSIVAFFVALVIHLMVKIIHAVSARSKPVENAKEIEAALAIAIAMNELKK